jgi:hypothetical protein
MRPHTCTVGMFQYRCGNYSQAWTAFLTLDIVSGKPPTRIPGTPNGPRSGRGQPPGLQGEMAAGVPAAAVRARIFAMSARVPASLFSCE